jgi:hypothetical protein
MVLSQNEEPKARVPVSRTPKTVTKKGKPAPQPSTLVRPSSLLSATASSGPATISTEKMPTLLKNAPVYVQATWTSDFQPALYEAMCCSNNPFTLDDVANGMDFKRCVQDVFNLVHPGRKLVIDSKDAIYLTVRGICDPSYIT